MAGTRRASESLVLDGDDVASLPAHDPSGVMPESPLTSSTRSTATTVTEEKPAGGLSLTQVYGGALAAVTAAVAASFLGVAGTLIGAGVGSVISTLAAALYSNSLNRAARVSRTLVVGQTLAPAAPSPQPEVADPPGEPAPEPHPVRDAVWQRLRWKPVLLAAAGAFVAAIAVIQVSEALVGHPIAGAGGAGRRMTNRGGSSSSTSPPPTPTPTDTPSSGTPTPTPSGSASPPDATPGPSASSPSVVPGSTAPTPATTAPTTTAPSTQATVPTGG